MAKDTIREIVIPGEVIVSGDDFLPGEGTEKQGKNIVAMKYGLAEEQNRLIKIIPLSGTYSPRRGNVIIGKVEELTFNGWVIDINTPERAFLSLMEVPRYVNKDALEEVMDLGEIVVAKIWSINKRGIDLSIKSRGLGKIEEGMILEVNPNKVPRIIGKEGSMIKLIKDETGCNITVGQNGFIWIKGNKIEDELLAKRAILFIVEKSFVSGLTDEVTKWFKESKK
tara:strand:- start:3122 stop:3796 length:675 start_codon:yes stop_codon:yes gene_type:complete